MFSEIEKEHPFLKETLLSAMGNVETSRLLDTRFLDLDANSDELDTRTPELISLHSL
jgi:tRNA 2-thiocytidine biosynthesis protein TtcA